MFGEWGWDASHVIYKEIGIHYKYSKLITSVFLLHQCICVCCLNVGEWGAWNEIKHPFQHGKRSNITYNQTWRESASVAV